MHKESEFKSKIAKADELHKQCLQMMKEIILKFVLALDRIVATSNGSFQDRNKRAFTKTTK
jgi:hypothetical protein